jgi:hypothetical protein
VRVCVLTTSGCATTVGGRGRAPTSTDNGHDEDDAAVLDAFQRAERDSRKERRMPALRLLEAVARILGDNVDTQTVRELAVRLMLDLSVRFSGTVVQVRAWVAESLTHPGGPYVLDQATGTPCAAP